MARRKRGLSSQLWFAKLDARNRGLAWHISDKRAMKLMQQVCHWCGAPPSPYNGLDRLNNEPFYQGHNRSLVADVALQETWALRVQVPGLG